MPRAPKTPSAQASVSDEQRAQREERMLKRLRLMSNWLADVESKLPAQRREIDGMIAELERG